MKQLLAVFTFCLSAIFVQAQSPVIIKDNSFKAALIEAGVDKNSDGKIQSQEALLVESINVKNKNIISLDGIQAFVNLKYLICSANQIESLDLSKNLKLSKFNCSNNLLKVLDVSKNTNLTVLYCRSNKLAGLNLVKNTNLQELECGGNALTALDVSKNTKLTMVDCNTNPLTTIKVAATHNTAEWIKDPTANWVSPASKDIAVKSAPSADSKAVNASLPKAKPVAEKKVPVPGSFIAIPDKNFKLALMETEIDLNNDGEIQPDEAKELKEMNVYGKNISSLEGIHHFENISKLNCAANQLVVLDLTKNTKLTDIFCKENKLKSLDLSKNEMLEELTCTSNQLTALNIAANQSLKVLECSSNLITTLDASNHPVLQWLDCRWNKLTALNVSRCPELKTLFSDNNLIKKIYISEDQNKTEWTKDEATQWFVNTFTDCNAYNIVSDMGHADCLKKYENDKFTYQYHPLWKNVANADVTTQTYEVTQETPFNSSFPLFSQYKYVNFKHSVSRTYGKTLETIMASIKSPNKTAKEFPFMHSSKKKGKIVTFNYAPEGAAAKVYEVHTIIPTSVKDSYLYAVMTFACAPNADATAGVPEADEPAFREFATAYFNTLRAK